MLPKHGPIDTNLRGLTTLVGEASAIPSGWVLKGALLRVRGHNIDAPLDIARGITARHVHDAWMEHGLVLSPSREPHLTSNGTHHIPYCMVRPQNATTMDTAQGMAGYSNICVLMMVAASRANLCLCQLWKRESCPEADDGAPT